MLCRRRAGATGIWEELQIGTAQPDSGICPDVWCGSPTRPQSWLRKMKDPVRQAILEPTVQRWALIPLTGRKLEQKLRREPLKGSLRGCQA